MHRRFPAFDYKDPAAILARLKEFLPPEHWLAFQTVSSVAQAEGQSVFLVGGIVRDLLLDRPNLDLDFVTLIDARLFARQLVPLFENQPEITQVGLLTHDPFKTARLDLTFQNGVTLHIDLATARREIYQHPAALPTVAPEIATLEVDLLRRDFTINAMTLSPKGGLVDPFNGLEDLRDGLLKVLHAKSFEDDPTRMARGIRFAARFGYHFASETEHLFKEAVAAGYFSLLSPERRRNELRLILKEVRPEKAVALLQHYHLLQAIQSGLEWNNALGKSFRQLRDYLPEPPSYLAYLAALLHLTSPVKAEEILRGLRFSSEEAAVPVAVAHLWQEVRPKLVPDLKNSQLYALLHPYFFPTETLIIFEALLKADEPERAAQIVHFRQNLAHLRPALDGEFLKSLGLKPGPQFRIWLEALRNAVLDGEIKGRVAEEQFLRRIIN
jgi:tRNA nucleotidyltransferase (CCA-adding enzyme)